MNTRTRLLHVTAVCALAAGALAAVAPAATAATPTCESVMMATDSEGNLRVREITNDAITSEKTTASPLAAPLKSIVWLDSVKVNAGYVGHINAFPESGKPTSVSVTVPSATDTITTKTTKTYSSAFTARAVTGSGRYYVYGIAASGNLVRWTRFNDGNGGLTFGDPKTVATKMSGIRTLQYSWTYSIDGKATDFLVATTSTGALKQIRVPWSSPATETVKVLATDGFADITGLSLAFCSNSENYLSLIAINSNEGEGGSARWYTLYNLKAPTTSALIDRGLVAPAANWHLNAVT